jgi:hypothetical protein
LRTCGADQIDWQKPAKPRRRVRMNLIFMIYLNI